MFFLIEWMLFFIVYFDLWVLCALSDLCGELLNLDFNKLMQCSIAAALGYTLPVHCYSYKPRSKKCEA